MFRYEDVVDSLFEIINTTIIALANVLNDAEMHQKFAIAIYGTLFGVVGTIGVSLGRFIIKRWRSFISQRIVTQTLELKSEILPKDAASRIKIYCLVVRYGTDAYFQHLASDQEKYEGRLQNRILHNQVISRWSYDPRRANSLIEGIQYGLHRLLGRRVISENSGMIETKFKLPIHTRLGTQFKFFFEIVEDSPKRRGILLTVADKISEVQRREKYFKVRLSPNDQETGGTDLLVTVGENAEKAAETAAAPNAERQLDEESSAYKLACAVAEAYNLPPQDIVRRYKSTGGRRSVLCYRLWFTLADFPRVRTADGLENNMAFPI